MKRFYRAAVGSLGLLLVAAPGHAQSQTFPGFVSPYEVMRMVRASGFAPLAPPMRQGTTYVLRVTDFRGILMRVVVDGRTGAFREVSRIVPGPGRYGPPYGVAYGPPEYDAAMAIPPEAEVEPPLARPAAVHPAPIAVAPPAAALVPPLPRPRPASLASRGPVDAKPTVNPQAAPSANSATKTEATATTSALASPPAGSAAAPAATAPVSGTTTIAKPAAPPDAKPQVNSEVVTAPPPPAAAARKSAIPVEPLND